MPATEEKKSTEPKEEVKQGEDSSVPSITHNKAPHIVATTMFDKEKGKPNPSSNAKLIPNARTALI